MQTLRDFMPPPFLHWYRCLRYPDYRFRSREIARLKSLPRYHPTFTELAGAPLEIVDAASFLFMRGEIFEQQIYRFQAASQTPYIIDGGANIGLSVIYFKEIYPQSRIVAFEPDDEVFLALERNVNKRGYENVELLCRALWSSETSLSFMHEGADGGRIAQLGDLKNKTVQTVRLRDYLDRRVDFLKLDVEGAETEVLVDCADLLGNVQNLFVEYHSFVGSPQTLPTVINILANAGFRLQIHTPVTSPQPFVYRNVNLGMDMQLNIFAFRA
ncbi:MAG: FkbM family methyltransferase [Acidobacteriota bacterium]|nr:FkbM family methyltransferase [Acidobacteriota bacterium]